MSDDVKPVEDWVFVRKEGSWSEQDHAGSSVLLLVEDEPAVEVGTVLSVGPGEHRKTARIEMEVSPGDRVIFRAFSGTDYGSIGEKDHVFLKLGEVLARVVDDSTA
jgi:co-chaperonin GroES (HSP10)